MLNFDDIIEVRAAESPRNGYEIVFKDNKIVWVIKKRALIGLLLLLKYEICTEADLAGANTRLLDLKNDLSGKINSAWIKDRYGDANKPFSELWTEEGFSCVHAEGLIGNRQYVLRRQDTDLLLNISAKGNRVSLSREIKNKIINTQNNRCNICGAKFKTPEEHTFSKDRVKCEFDHRIPIDRGGENKESNIQALCHYCNKCKRQMCFVCRESSCSEYCALVNPESNTIVIATGEDITDRITKIIS